MSVSIVFTLTQISCAWDVHRPYNCMRISHITYVCMTHIFTWLWHSWLSQICVYSFSLLMPRGIHSVPYPLYISSIYHEAQWRWIHQNDLIVLKTRGCGEGNKTSAIVPPAALCAYTALTCGPFTQQTRQSLSLWAFPLRPSTLKPPVIPAYITWRSITFERTT